MPTQLSRMVFEFDWFSVELFKHEGFPNALIFHLFLFLLLSLLCPAASVPPLPSPPLPHTTHWPSRSSNDLRFPFPPSDLYVIVYMSLASPSTLPPYTCLRHNQTCILAATTGPFFLHQGYGAPPPPPPSPPQSSKRHPRIMIKATCGDENIGCYGLFCVYDS